MIVYQPRTRFNQWLHVPANIYYLRIGAETAVLRNVRTHNQVEATPGDIQQRAEAVDLCASPAMLAVRIPAAARLLRVLVDRLDHPARWRYPLRLMKGNAVLVHPLRFAEGALPAADRAVLHAIAKQAGFRDVGVWTGPDLNDEAVLRYFGASRRWLVEIG